MGKYDDIINLPHHVSNVHKPMTMENRAAQFAPFAALSGHEEAISETSRLTQKLVELSDIEKEEISYKLNMALIQKSAVKITFFRVDVKKGGGKYQSIKGRLKNYDELESKLSLTDGTIIPVKHITEFEIL